MAGSPLVKGWVFSICLHAAVVAGAMWIVTEQYSRSPEEVFRWDVMLVEDSESGELQVSAPAEPKTDAESALGDRVKSSSRLQHEAVEHHVIETDEPPQKANQPPARVIPDIEHTKQIVERVVSSESAQGVVKRIDSVETTTKTMAPVVAEEEPSIASMSGVITTVTPVSSQPSQAARPLDSAVQETASDMLTQADKVVPTPTLREVEAQPARAVPSPTLTARVAPSAKTDLGWLAKTMYRRITELKQYPHAARVHHWEGKVVLRAVIRQDGHLAELSLESSSGYDLLDQEAMDLVRQVCPLPLERTLGRPHVVMYVPITYTLEN